MNRDHLQRLLFAERGQDRGHPPRKHRFPGARRPDEQNVVTACGGNFQRPLRGLLTDYVGEVSCVATQL
jgi:hypothetical protein